MWSLALLHKHFNGYRIATKVARLKKDWSNAAGWTNQKDIHARTFRASIGIHQTIWEMPLV